MPPLADRIGLFTWLAGGRSTTAEDLAAWQGTAVRPAELLLTACAALGLLEPCDGGSFRHSEMSEEYLVQGKPYYFGGWVKVVDQHDYPAYIELERSFRGNHPTNWDMETQESLFAPRASSARARRRWSPAGTCWYASRLSTMKKSGPVLAALMSLNMLVETWGRNYTVAEYSNWTSAAGPGRRGHHHLPWEPLAGDTPVAACQAVGFRDELVPDPAAAVLDRLAAPATSPGGTRPGPRSHESGYPRRTVGSHRRRGRRVDRVLVGAEAEISSHQWVASTGH